MKVFNKKLNRFENQFLVSRKEAQQIAGDDVIKLGGLALDGFVVTHSYDPKQHMSESGGHTWNRFIVLEGDQ